MLHEFLAGADTIDTTIALGYDVGGLVLGQGGGEITTNPTYHTDQQSRVTVNANPGIWVQGASQVVRDASFMGPGKDDVSGAVGIAMYAPEGASGLQQGGCTFDNLGFEAFPIAIQTGRTNDSSWADTSRFGMIVATLCQTVVNQKNLQGALNTYHHIHARNCERVFDVEAGGNLHAYDCSVTSVESGETCSFLRLGNSSYVGHQKGEFNLHGIKFDDQVNDNVRLVEMTDDASANINIYGGQHAGAGDGDLVEPLIVMNTNGILNIWGYRGLYPGCIYLDGSSSADPICINIVGAAVQAEVDFDLRDLIAADSTAKGQLIAIGCHQHRSGRQFVRSRFQSRVGAWA